MLRQFLACVLLAAPLLVVADPTRVKQFHGLAESETSQMFQHFTSEFGRNYNPKEYTKRLNIFRQNLEVIDRLNREEKGTAIYGITPFADLTYDEFRQKYTGGKLSEKEWKQHAEQMELDSDPGEEIEFMDDIYKKLPEDESDSAESGEEDDEEEGLVRANGKVYLPKKFDYRKKNAVTSVKNQGDCGSCWAFSVMVNIEGLCAKEKNELMNLSEQQCLDCDEKNHACAGGWMPVAVKEVVRLGGVAPTSKYPYEGKKQNCRFVKSMAAVKVAGTKSIPADEKKMAKALVDNAPLSVAVVASERFQFYNSDIFDPTEEQCSRNKEDVNHAVTIVAYVEDNKNPYWVVKNSWGTNWGEEGYMKIAKGKNACAISSYVSTAYNCTIPK